MNRLNSLENERVVELLLAAVPAGSLVVAKDTHSRLAPLIARPGLSEATKHCARLYPHDNDAGGFFVCKLLKTREFDLADCKVQVVSAARSMDVLRHAGFQPTAPRRAAQGSLRRV